MTASVQFYFDFRSPYSYLASTQLESLGAEITLKPIQVLKLMEQVGNVPTSITCRPKGIYAQVDMGRWVRRYGLSLNPSNIRLTDGDACSRAVLSAATSEQALAVTHALYHAIWAGAKTLENTADVLAALGEAGIDTAEIAQRIDSAEIIAALSQNTAEAAARGAFGVPTVYVGDAMFFGNDRLDFVRDEISRQQEAS